MYTELKFVSLWSVLKITKVFWNMSAIKKPVIYYCANKVIWNDK